MELVYLFTISSIAFTCTPLIPELIEYGLWMGVGHLLARSASAGGDSPKSVGEHPLKIGVLGGILPENQVRSIP